MIKRQTNPDSSKSRGLILLEYALLTLFVCVIALRVIFTEGLPAQSIMNSDVLQESVYGLSISAVLLVSFFIWLVWNISSKKSFYHPTGMEIGLIIFFIASVISGLAAADKRLAFTHILITVVPLLFTILLVQILDHPVKIKLILLVIAALGLLSAYQSAELFFFGNREMIQAYEQSPGIILEQFGIEPGTLQQFLFEHRIYSKSLKAFFTTRNSAGSFLLLSFFSALPLLILKIKNRQKNQNSTLYRFSGIIPVTFILLALIMTKSKGAIIGFIFAVTILMIYYRYGKHLKNYRKIILTTCIFFAIACICIVTWYGLKHDHLPGGNSMLVRWQYWHATAKMYADNPFTGVGPGNFADFYTQYKSPASLETVSDPHNFILSIISQYGPLGLVGFLAMIMIPLWKIYFAQNNDKIKDDYKWQHAGISPLINIIIILWLCILLGRQFIVPAIYQGGFLLIFYMTLRFFTPAVIVFIVGFLLLHPESKTNKNNISSAGEIILIKTVLFCALLGVLLHNMTDFAVFESGVYTCFLALIASLIASDSLTQQRRQYIFKVPNFGKLLTIAFSILICFFFFNLAFFPSLSTTNKIKQANLAIQEGNFIRAHSLLDTAAESDRLSSTALVLNARLYMGQLSSNARENQEMLINAERLLKAASERNKAEYKNYERLTQVYLLLSENSSQTEASGWLQKAFVAALEAVRRYPGSGRLQFTMAETANKLGNTEVAIERYNQAISIEQQYQQQFKQMYPTEEVVSRLGDEKYQFALNRIKELTEN